MTTLKIALNVLNRYSRYVKTLPRTKLGNEYKKGINMERGIKGPPFTQTKLSGRSILE